MRTLLLISTLIKLLLMPAYRSTDFEVHRNWLAITHSLPLANWYLEKTSEWTLDYPPFFAWFEKWLSMFAPLADPSMLDVQNLNYQSNATVIFQRLTVIASELVLYWALQRYIISFGSHPVRWILAGSILMHPALLIVDLTHLHFQYNGFMYGILIHSIVEAKRDNLLVSGILFAALLNFKHIYLYMAPAYFIYLLQAYCFVETQAGRRFSMSRLLALGGAVIAVFALSFGPFFYLGQIPTVLGRLFPFKRGLCHAYWAPNFWAIYAGADRVLAIAAKRLNWKINEEALGSMTRGFVGDTVFAVLPTIEASHTMLFTVLVQFMVLRVLWKRPTFDKFLSALTLCGFASFLFGWHVHEKAIMMVLLPFGLMATGNAENLRILVVLNSAGLYSLYPLLFHLAETPIKIIITLLWFLAVVPALAHYNQIDLKTLLRPIELCYIIGLFGLQLYTSVIHELVFVGQFEFLPLLLTSVYCALGVIYGWLLFMHHFMTSS